MDDDCGTKLLSSWLLSDSCGQFAHLAVRMMLGNGDVGPAGLVVAEDRDAPRRAVLRGLYIGPGSPLATPLASFQESVARAFPLSLPY